MPSRRVFAIATMYRRRWFRDEGARRGRLGEFQLATSNSAVMKLIRERRPDECKHNPDDRNLVEQHLKRVTVQRGALELTLK